MADVELCQRVSDWSVEVEETVSKITRSAKELGKISASYLDSVYLCPDVLTVGTVDPEKYILNGLKDSNRTAAAKRS